MAVALGAALAAGPAWTDAAAPAAPTAKAAKAKVTEVTEATEADHATGPGGTLVPPLRLELLDLTPTRAHAEARYYQTGAPFESPEFERGPVLEPRKNYWIPALEVVGINLGIWSFDYLTGRPFAQISGQTIKDNFNKGWIVDTDDFWANQFMHPYHGALTFNAARSMGLSFYESFAYSFAGSLMWEQFLEIQPPSMNDQVNTPFGGAMVGEVLWRMYRMILDSGGYAPGGWRQFFAFLVSPAAGLNRLAFGDEYRGPLLLPPSWIGEFRVGLLVSGSTTDNRTGARSSQFGPWGAVGVNLVYGVPGTPDLRLRNPFDHFDFQATLATTDTPQPTASLIVQGLLHGATIGPGGDFGGLWGLYTSYDFVAAQVYRAAGFGLGPGVELMKRWGWFELHGSTLVELLPWSGAGSTVPLGARDYHYGVGAKGYVQLRLHFDDRATLRLTGREYFVSGSYARGSSEDVSYGTVSLTLRIWGPHAVNATVDGSRRSAVHAGAPTVDQKGAVWTLAYALLQGW